MKKRIWRRLLLPFLGAMCLFLVSCAIVNPDYEAMLSPPTPTGEKEMIQLALEEYMGGNFTLKYPRSGDLKSAITMKDLDLDGNEEVIVFCRPGNESGGTHLILMDQQDGKWRVCADIAGPGVDVEKVLMTRFTNDREWSILISWNLYSKNKIATVYTYRNGEVLSLLNDYAFTEMIVADFNADGMDELFTVLLNSTEMTAEGKLFRYDAESERMQQISQVPLDGNISSYAQVISGNLDRYETMGIVLDEYKSATVLQTEILCWDKKEEELRLLNLQTEDSAPGTNDSVLENDMKSGFFREEPVLSRDIDQDGILEIPVITYCDRYVLEEKEGIDEKVWKREQQKEYFVTWMEYSANKQEFSSAIDSILNQTEKYYMVLVPRREQMNWLEDVYLVYEYEKRQMSVHWVETDEEMFRIAVFSESEWGSKSTEGYTELERYNGLIYGYQLANSALTKELRIYDRFLKGNFHLIEE